MQSPIQSLFPQSVLGWSPGSGSASSDNRSTSVRTPSQHQFAFDGYFTGTFSLTPPACRQTESRKKARGADPQRGRPVYPDRDDKDLSLLELRLEWSRTPGEILNQWILSQECSIRTRGQGRCPLLLKLSSVRQSGLPSFEETTYSFMPGRRKSYWALSIQNSWKATSIPR